MVDMNFYFKKFLACFGLIIFLASFYTHPTDARQKDMNSIIRKLDRIEEKLVRMDDSDEEDEVESISVKHSPTEIKEMAQRVQALEKENNRLTRLLERTDRTMDKLVDKMEQMDEKHQVSEDKKIVQSRLPMKKLERKAPREDIIEEREEPLRIDLTKPDKNLLQMPSRPDEESTEIVSQPLHDPLPTTAAEQYNYAQSLLKKGDFPRAQAVLSTFLKDHPRDPLAGNAQYWIGETFFAQQNYSDASAAFLTVFKNYPKHPKQPESLLKLSKCLRHLGKKQEACASLKKLSTTFPLTSGSIKKMAEEEKSRLGCS